MDIYSSYLIVENISNPQDLKIVRVSFKASFQENSESECIGCRAIDQPTLWSGYQWNKVKQCRSRPWRGLLWNELSRLLICNHK